MRERLDGLVVAEDDERAGAAAEDALEPVAQRRCPGATAARVARSRSAARASLASAAASCHDAAVLGAARTDLLDSIGVCRQSRCSVTGRDPRSRQASREVRGRRRPAAAVERPADSGPRSRARLGRHERVAEAEPAPPRPGAAAERRAPGAARRRGRSRRSPRRPAAPRLAARGRGDRERDARSPAGSTRRTPPTVDDEDVVRGAAGRRACARRTARIIATREESTPDVVRRGRSAGCAATRAWTSASSGRRPSRATDTQVPATGLVVAVEEQPGRVGERRRCRRRSGRSSRPRRPGRSGS